jgi:hypothetical protein
MPGGDGRTNPVGAIEAIRHVWGKSKMRWSYLGIILIGELLFPKAGQRLTAPTYYIAARATYDSNPKALEVRGVSNLPAGSILAIEAYDSLGEKRRPLSESKDVAVGADGFFDVTLTAAAGSSFRHNIACSIIFMMGPEQPASVRQIVGKHGDHLGYPENPLAYVGSGDEEYLLVQVHVL